MGGDQAPHPVIVAASRGAVLRMFSSALASQVVLSATSLLVGLMLIRRTNDLQYSYYILMTGALLLLTSLQNSFIAPPMIGRMTQLSPSACGELTGGLYREQRQVIAWGAGLSVIGAALLRLTGVIDTEHLLLGLAALAAVIAALRREFFRMVLLAYRRAHPVLRGDLVYALLLTLGVLAATYDTRPATMAMLALGGSALVAGGLLFADLRRQEAWDTQGAQGILRQIAPLGAWSTSGAAVHWTFSQGYAFLIAATLDIRAVAAVAATRLLVMPVNLLSAGIGSLMLPLVSRWLQERAVSQVLRRLSQVAVAIGLAAIAYFTLLWWMRDWVFDQLLHKQFAQRDALLLLWSCCFVVVAINQQLIWLLIARARFRRLTALGLLSAIVALACAYAGMRSVGAAGAPLGVLIGELIQFVGITMLCLHEARPVVRLQVASHAAG